MSPKALQDSYLSDLFLSLSLVVTHLHGVVQLCSEVILLISGCPYNGQVAVL